MNKLGDNFMNEDTVNKTYTQWIHSPTLFQHWLDRRRFYIFVKACVNYVKNINFVKKEIAWRELNLEYLTERLSYDLPDIHNMDSAQCKKLCNEIMVKFEFLIEYEKTQFSFRYASLE